MNSFKHQALDLICCSNISAQACIHFHPMGDKTEAQLSKVK